MTREEFDNLSIEDRYDILFDMFSDMPCSFDDLIADIPVEEYSDDS